MRALLFIVIFIEGYVVLAAELLAIRLVTPLVGASTDTISVIIAAVLLPLAFGYHAGGNYRRRHTKRKKPSNLRRKLVMNILVAALFLSLALSYPVVNGFFDLLGKMDIHARVPQTIIWCLAFLVAPIYLLGQTIPLVSNYFSSGVLSQVTGRMLFFSTIGSFMGSVFTTIVLMAHIGVNNTVIINIFLLALLVFLLTDKKYILHRVFALMLFVLTLGINNTQLLERKYDVVSNNHYNTLRVREVPGTNARVMMQNNNASTAFDDKRGPLFIYTQYINSAFIRPLMATEEKEDILLLGGGGLTIGYNDEQNNYTYVDIDPATKPVSEDLFLKFKMTPNKKFEGLDARAFLRENDGKQKYDLIVLDAFAAGKTFPEHLVTREYFKEVKAALKDGGQMVMNVLACPNFEDTFSVNLDNTVRSVFPMVNRTVVSKHYNAWDSYRSPNQGICLVNVMYSARLDPDYKNEGDVYADLKNKAFIDR